MRLFIGIVLLVSWMAAISARAGEPIELTDRLELFVDDYLIAEMSGDLHHQLHKPQPHDVVLVTDQPWEGNTSAYYTIFRDGDLLRMYYRGSHWDEVAKRATHPEVTCYAESRDGIHWTKPSLGIVDWEGSKENNIILTGLGSHCFVAMRDDNPDCPDEKRYKGISRGRPDGKRGLYVFSSPDAIHWELMLDEPVITDGAFDSQNLAFWDPVSKKYVDYHRTFVDGVRSIMTCNSDDFLHWTKPKLLTYADAPNQHLYTNAIRPYPRAPHIRIGFPTRYEPQGSRVEPLFMSSRDGISFRRWSDPVIPQSAPKDRDGNRSNYMANGLVELPSEPGRYSVYATEAYYTGPDSRLRRFSYRIDGFVSIRGGEQGGNLLTKPLRCGGGQLLLNYAATNGGTIVVHVLDAKGNPVKGYEESESLAGDAVDQPVVWPAGEKLPEGTALQLRFTVKNADLYSLRVRP